jgi:hypothetical protein
VTNTPDRIALNVGVSPEDGRIDDDDIGPYTHTVKWAEDGGRPSSVRYCNNCGSALSRQITHRGLGRLLEHPDKAIRICAQCGVFQGFVV